MPSLNNKSASKNSKLTVALSAFAISGAGVVNALAATATLNIFARIVYAIDLSVNTSLNFGTIAMTGLQEGEAVIDPSVNRMFIGSDSSLSLASGEPQAGQIRVRAGMLPVAISVEDTIVRLTNGTSEVTVKDFNFETANGGARITVTPSAVGQTLTLALGATIVTKVGQLSGSYIGANRVFANYQ